MQLRWAKCGWSNPNVFTVCSSQEAVLWHFHKCWLRRKEAPRKLMTIRWIAELKSSCHRFLRGYGSSLRSTLICCNFQKFSLCTPAPPPSFLKSLDLPLNDLVQGLLFSVAFLKTITAIARHSTKGQEHYASAFIVWRLLNKMLLTYRSLYGPIARRL